MILPVIHTSVFSRTTSFFRGDPLTRFPAGRKLWNKLRGHRHILPRPRVATGARRSVVDLETTKPAHLDSPSCRQARGHRFKYRIDHNLDVLCDQLRIAPGQPGDQPGFRHSWYRANRAMPIMGIMCSATRTNTLRRDSVPLTTSVTTVVACQRPRSTLSRNPADAYL